MDEPETESRQEDTSETLERFDLLRYQHGPDPYWPVPAGDGQRVVDYHETDAYWRRVMGTVTAGIIPVIIAIVLGFLYSYPLAILVGAGVVVGAIVSVIRYLHEDHQIRVPEIVVSGVSARVVSDYVDDFDPEEVDPDEVSHLFE